MTPAESVAIDALRELGLERLTLWHLRCVEAFLAAMPDHHVGPGERLLEDLRSGPERLHADAQWEDAQRTVYCSGLRQPHLYVGVPARCTRCGWYQHGRATGTPRAQPGA